MTRLKSVLLLLIFLACPVQAFAVSADTAFSLAAGEFDTRLQALDKVVTAGDLPALPFLEKLLAGEVRVSATAAFVMQGDKATDPETGAEVMLPADAEDAVNSNRMRIKIDGAIAALKLASPDRDTRLSAAKALQEGDLDEGQRALLATALEGEQDKAVKEVLLLATAAVDLSAEEAATRVKAVQALAESTAGTVKELLSSRLRVEGDAGVKAEIAKALTAIDRRNAGYEYAGLVFTGISLASILLLAALGLAITYGLMGVINMAHGELMMIGAYATYVVQNLFRVHWPDAFQWYLPAAVPVAFVVTAAVGVLIERTVVRFLYGRALETLLATWGISLILMQAVRTLFGAQNVQVENPVWMSGALTLAPSLVLPFNRIVIIFFSLAVLGFMAWLLTRTRLGLFVRAVTQNRTMASCIGVPTKRVDTVAFGLGCGIAGLAGVALSQIGNVGPDLGQAYIVNSFMVVVLGGVGQLAGAVLAAIGVGIVAKLMENMAGAVLAQIAVLVFVIIFIQKRPQGMFALRGRSAEA